MFLCQPLLEVLAGRGIEDIDAFLKVPSWNDLPDPFSIPSMEKATSRVLCAVRRRERITIFGDYDCDGVLGTHILRSVLNALGVAARTYLPHRNEGYGLSSSAVHHFSCSGTDLLITVDNGINARAAVHLAQRLGIDVVVIDHHRIQEQVETTAIWSDAFCGAGLAAMFAWALALSARWTDTKVEHLLSRCSQYAAIASIADCVSLRNGTRTLARLGLAELSRSRHKGLQGLLKSACADPSQPDSHDVAFGIAPRINAAGRMAHPAEALAVFEAATDEEAARHNVDRLNQLNLERRRILKVHFEELVESLGTKIPAGLVFYRETSPSGIAGLLASKSVERYSVPSIVLVPSSTPGLVVGSGRSIAGVDLVETLRPLGHLFLRFGGHAQAVGLTMAVDHIEEFREAFARSLEAMVKRDCQRIKSPTAPLFRIGRKLDPWSPPDWSRAQPDGTFGNRFDDPQGNYRVLYAASQRVACFVETLARFRPDLTLVAELQEITGEDDYVPIGTVPSDWCNPRSMGEAMVAGSYADIYSAGWIAHLRKVLAADCIVLGLEDLDGAILQQGTQRRLTQLASLKVNDAGLDGIYYRSRYGHDLENWALFEPFLIKYRKAQLQFALTTWISKWPANYSVSASPHRYDLEQKAVPLGSVTWF